MVIPVLIACSFIEQSIGYTSAAAANETKTADHDVNIKSDVKKKDCKDNGDGNDNSEACLNSNSKDSVASESSSDSTQPSPHNENDDNKKHKDPFLLPFP